MNCEQDGCDRPVASRGLCATHYQRLRRNGSAEVVRKRGRRQRSAFDRVWDHVRVQGDCLLYGEKDYGPQGGYYQILSHKDSCGKPVNKLVHRVVYEGIHGKLAPGVEVMHECDRTTCIQPNHLRGGSRTENERMKDRSRRAEDRRRTFRVVS